MSRSRGRPSEGGKKERYDLGPAPNFDYDTVKRRVMTDDEYRTRFPRLSVDRSIDDVLGGGLPYGLVTLYGEGGSGKSKFAGRLSQRVANKHGTVVFAAAEARTDVPKHENIIGLNFAANKPRYQKAVDYLIGFCQREQPHLLVIDSGTKMFSKTDKAVEEADVRSALSRLEEQTEGKLSAVVTSEVRGSPGWEYPAGGQAVSHSCSMLIRLRRHEATTAKEADALDTNIGEVTWTFSVEKDRENKANTSHLFKPEYTRRGIKMKRWETTANRDV